MKIHEVWAECVGKVASKHTSKLFLKGNKLFVEFSTPLLKHEVHFRKADLLKLLEENVPIELILSNQNEDPSFHELEKQNEMPSDELIKLAVELYTINVSQGVPKELELD